MQRRKRKTTPKAYKPGVQTPIPVAILRAAIFRAHHQDVGGHLSLQDLGQLFDANRAPNGSGKQPRIFSTVIGSELWRKMSLIASTQVRSRSQGIRSSAIAFLLIVTLPMDQCMRKGKVCHGKNQVKSEIVTVLV